MEDNSIDFIVTDPPYGLHFMGKGWDKFSRSKIKEDYFHYQLPESSNRKGTVRSISCGNSHAGTYDESRNDEFQEFVYQVGIEIFRILKPGGMLAMFGAPRRHHRQMSGLEDAGFEIRDCIAWVFGSGFPKSHNFGRKMKGDWKKYGTALKPAYEPIIIAMKPLDGTFAQNAEKWGVAGINIDESRIGTEKTVTSISGGKGFGSNFRDDNWIPPENSSKKENIGRWPANIIFDEEAAQELDKMTGNRPSCKKNIISYDSALTGNFRKSDWKGENTYDDNSGASRFFYCAKASSSERNKGLEKKRCNELQVKNYTSNFHPTVKPIALMKYIIKLLAPPGNPILLDPFAGSGSTIVAAKELGISAIGIEKEKEYIDIATKRVDAASCINQLEMFK
jgi:site-specific DNA-methyltransferase (adenine-specific)